MKKLLVFIVAIIVILSALHLSGVRDLGQLSLAWDKKQQGGSFSGFLSDVGMFIRGEKVRESLLPPSEYVEKAMYRWTDENGQVHVSEIKPEVENFEIIKMGELKYQTQEGMSQEEIDAAIGKKKEN
ncbi:MAG: DUF4124 domain-containing protein [Gammaproteobacteria bacterium]|nr:DUF4124 domain-containing protein [Gammaproteobacteria bacterium]